MEFSVRNLMPVYWKAQWAILGIRKKADAFPYLFDQISFTARVGSGTLSWAASPLRESPPIRLIPAGAQSLANL